jgi:hypothetical protein
MVASLTVTFDRPVTVDPGALQVRRQDGALVGVFLITSVVNGRTGAVVGFTGPGIVGGSPADGNYTLTVRGDLIHDAVPLPSPSRDRPVIPLFRPGWARLNRRVFGQDLLNVTCPPD